MKQRLLGLPEYARNMREIPAHTFNPIRVALLRLGTPRRIELRQLRSLDVILEQDVWVCVDRDLNDLPVIAWTDFQVAQRGDLSAPVTCVERQYHQHAQVIVDSLWSGVQTALEQELALRRNQ